MPFAGGGCYRGYPARQGLSATLCHVGRAARFLAESDLMRQATVRVPSVSLG